MSGVPLKWVLGNHCLPGGGVSHGAVDMKDSMLGLASVKVQLQLGQCPPSSQPASVAWSRGSWDRHPGGWAAGRWGQLCVTGPRARLRPSSPLPT